ncbi:MAG: hypothetical protein KKG95_01935, partial [Candidatus Omnitrophica bacterium]|nr:hypothetical protein [Candidatus Omnitrophota bacterium]
MTDYYDSLVKPKKTDNYHDCSANGDSLSISGGYSRHKGFFKSVALIVSFVFFFQQLGVAQAASGAGGSQAREAPISAANAAKGGLHINLHNFSISRDIGITRDVQIYDSKEVIINIKDVHDNYGAQESIVSVLDNLAINYDVRFVGIEGSEGYIDMSLISALPGEEAKKMTAEYLMREGKISAGEFFAALSKTPVTLYGIDSPDLYLKNYHAFMGLLDKKERNMKLVAALREALYALEDHVFSKELKALNRNSVLANDNGKAFTERWYFIEEIGRKRGVGCARYPNVGALMKAAEIEKAVNYAAVNRQRDAALDILTNRLKRDSLEELILRSLSFKLGKISKSQFYSYILTLAKAEALPREDYDDLEGFCDYVNLYESIDIGGLMDEIDDYE